MLFSARLPLRNLIELCRALRHNLSAGLTLQKVFSQQAKRGSAAVRPIAARIAQDIDKGESLEDALTSVTDAFPPLFLELARVGERTGNLAEIFAELEKYYLMQQKLWRLFVSKIRWPIIQLVAAIFIIAGLILVLGVIGSSNSGKALDPLGIGLTGTAGAVTFLAAAFGFFALLAGAYYLLSRTLRQQAIVDGLILHMPVIGPCWRALALARFCLALRLTMETGMTITAALRLSLTATGNAAFAARSEVMDKTLRSGDELVVALERGGLFPEEFREIVAVGEESGRLTEVLDHQAEAFEQEAGRRLLALTFLAGGGVYVLVAIFIIWAIFRIFTTAILPAYSI